MTSLYLASGSPRRQELLAQLGVTFERIVTGIEEQRQPQESAQQYVVRLAREKAPAGGAATAAGRRVSRKRRRISRCWVRILSLS